MACIQYPTLATHLMLFHVFRLCRRVRFFAANAKNNIAVLQNLSAVSVRNDLDFFPADSDIPEEITVHPSQRFARYCRESLCCKPTLVFFSSLTEVLACLF